VNSAIHGRLVRLAQARRTVSFDDIAAIVGTDARGRLSPSRTRKALSEISVYEHSRARPMLSVLVLHKEGNSPGPEFFALARSLGRYSGDDEASERAFIEAEMLSVWDQWQKAGADVPGEGVPEQSLPG
jgi:hypothetical protein